MVMERGWINNLTRRATIPEKHNRNAMRSLRLCSTKDAGQFIAKESKANYQTEESVIHPHFCRSRLQFGIMNESAHFSSRTAREEL